MLTREMVEKLLAHNWPGNVRELKNVAERFALGCELDIGDTQSKPSSAESIEKNESLSLGEKVAIFEKTLIENELLRNNWNIQETYKKLQLPRKTLYERLKKYGLTRNSVVSP